jgi:tripartite-type tricarboxylate transporter receptor subunit TctC
MYKLPYDVVDDFEPISMLPYAPQIIVSKSSIPAKNLSELLAWIKTNQNSVSYGASGVGSPSHVSAVLLQNMTGTKFQLVSYRGAGQIMTDIISGHIDLSIAAPTVVLEQWRAGNARAFAVTAKDRISAAPDIPTVDEAGLPGFYTSLWWGLWVPRGAPDYVIAKLNAAVVESLADPVVRARFAEQGLTCLHASDRGRRRSAPSRRSRSRNGGQSSRPLASRRNSARRVGPNPADTGEPQGPHRRVGCPHDF